MYQISFLRNFKFKIASIGVSYCSKFTTFINIFFVAIVSGNFLINLILFSSTNILISQFPFLFFTIKTNGMFSFNSCRSQFRRNLRNF